MFFVLGFYMETACIKKVIFLVKILFDSIQMIIHEKLFNLFLIKFVYIINNY